MYNKALSQSTTVQRHYRLPRLGMGTGPLDTSLAGANTTGVPWGTNTGANHAALLPGWRNTSRLTGSVDLASKGLWKVATASPKQPEREAVKERKKKTKGP